MFSGSALRALTSWEVEHTKFFEMQSIRFTSALRGYEASKRYVLEAFEFPRGHVVGQAPQNMPSKNFRKKITSSKIEKFSFLIFAGKTVRIDLILSQGERDTVFRPKKRF